MKSRENVEVGDLLQDALDVEEVRRLKKQLEENKENSPLKWELGLDKA